MFQVNLFPVPLFANLLQPAVQPGPQFHVNGFYPLQLKDDRGDIHIGHGQHVAANERRPREEVFLLNRFQYVDHFSRCFADDGFGRFRTPRESRRIKKLRIDEVVTDHTRESTDITDGVVNRLNRLKLLQDGKSVENMESFFF